MSIIRRHQSAITGVFPHDGNRRFVIGRQTRTRRSITLEGPPINVTRPRILPTDPVVGTVITCGTGLWRGERPITFGFNWLRSGLPLGVTTASYTVQAADAGFDLFCEVLATNAQGSDSAVSRFVSIPNIVQVFGPFVDAPSRTVFWIRGTTLANAQIGFSIDDDATDPEIWLGTLDEHRPEGLSKAAWRRIGEKLAELLP